MSTGQDSQGGADSVPRPARPERVPTGASELYLAVMRAANPAQPYPPDMMEEDQHIPGQAHRVSTTRERAPLPPGMESVTMELRYGIHPDMPLVPVALYETVMHTFDPSTNETTVTSWSVQLLPMGPDWVASEVHSTSPAGTLSYSGQPDATDRLLRSMVPEAQHIGSLAAPPQPPQN